MFTLALAMTLRPGAFEKYKLAHDQLWPELAAGMSANHVSMAIYRDGERLFYRPVGEEKAEGVLLYTN